MRKCMKEIERKEKREKRDKHKKKTDKRQKKLKTKRDQKQVRERQKKYKVRVRHTEKNVCKWFQHTVCTRSLESFYIVIYYIKWVELLRHIVIITLIN